MEDDGRDEHPGQPDRQCEHPEPRLAHGGGRVEAVLAEGVGRLGDLGPGRGRPRPGPDGDGEDEDEERDDDHGPDQPRGAPADLPDDRLEEQRRQGHPRPAAGRRDAEGPATAGRGNALRDDRDGDEPEGALAHRAQEDEAEGEADDPGDLAHPDDGEEVDDPDRQRAAQGAEPVDRPADEREGGGAAEGADEVGQRDRGPADPEPLDHRVDEGRDPGGLPGRGGDHRRDPAADDEPDQAPRGRRVGAGGDGDGHRCFRGSVGGRTAVSVGDPSRRPRPAATASRRPTAPGRPAVLHPERARAEGSSIRPRP